MSHQIPYFIPLIRAGNHLYALDDPDLRKKRRKNLRRGGVSVPPAYRFQDVTDWPWLRVYYRERSTFVRSVDPHREASVSEAWQQLSAASFTAETLVNLLRVLIETLPFDCRCLSECPALPSAGANGNIVDLRPWLSDRKQVRRVLIELAPYWKEAVEQLAGFRYEVERLKRSCPTGELCVDPFVLLWFDEELDINDFSRTPLECLTFYSTFREVPLADLGRAHRLIERFLFDFPEMEGALRRFLLTTPTGPALGWLEEVLRRPEGYREFFFKCLASSDARLIAPDDCVGRILENLDGIANAGQREACWWQLFGHLGHLETSYLECGFQLLRQFGGKINGSSASSTIGSEVIAGLVLRVTAGDAPPGDNSLAMKLWTACADWSRLASFLTDWNPDDYHVDVIYGVLSMACVISEEGSSAQEKGIRFIAEAVEIAQNIEEGRVVRFFDELGAFIENWRIDITSDAVRVCLLRIALLAARSNHQCPVDFLSRIVSTSNGSQLWSLGNLRESCLKKIGVAIRSENACGQIERGIEAYLEGSLDLSPLVLFPAKFLKTMRALGLLIAFKREEVLGRFKTHPFVELAPDRMPLPAALVVCNTVCREGVFHPMHNQLIAHVEGYHILTPRRLAHHWDEMRRDIHRTHLDLLGAEIGERFETDGIDPHTLVLSASVGRNRRALRRVIQNLKLGERIEVENHPANGLWLRSHAFANASVWIEGVRWVEHIQTLGMMVLSIERDIEECLKMGSYANSCLAPEGINAFSAVANSLDINKRVVYMRDERGRVIARQLLAISEEEELVCFEIYLSHGSEHEDDITDAFKQHAVHLAEEMSIPVCKGETYEIRSIVVRDWYDDGAIAM